MRFLKFLSQKLVSLGLGVELWSEEVDYGRLVSNSSESPIVQDCLLYVGPTIESQTSKLTSRYLNSILRG